MIFFTELFILLTTVPKIIFERLLDQYWIEQKILMVEISEIQKNNLPVVKIDFTIPDGDKKNNAYEKFNLLHIIVLRLLMNYQSLFHKFFCLLDQNHSKQQSYSLK